MEQNLNPKLNSALSNTFYRAPFRETVICKIFVFVFILSTTFMSGQNWEQMGTDIDDVGLNVGEGASVSISDDGLTIATGAFDSDYNGVRSGSVQMYTYSDSDWVIKGIPIHGPNTESGFGVAVSLSGDGNRVAISSHGHTSSGDPWTGKIRVYDWTGTQWALVGNELEWNSSNTEGRHSVVLSRNGEVLAVGEIKNSTNAIDSGQARLYTIEGTMWQQKGSAINGVVRNSWTGRRMSLSSDGNTFATNLKDAMQVYQWNGNDWETKGETLQPFWLRSVALNGDGNWIAVSGREGRGQTDERGAAQVYQWDGTSWIPEGNAIESMPRTFLGVDLSLSDSAHVLALSDPLDFGEVRLYVQNGSNWEQTGNTIRGEGKIECQGYAISLSATGNIIVIGSPGCMNYDNELESRTRVFRNDKMLGVSHKITFTPMFYPNPSNGHFNVDLGKEYPNVTIQITDMLGKLISTSKYASVKTIEQEIEGSSGIYFVNIDMAEGTSKSFKIIKN